MTAAQLDLPLAPPPDHVAAAFDAWAATPDGKEALREVEARAVRLHQAGHRSWGIAAIWEAIRYDRAVQIAPDREGWRLNNNHRALASRHIEARNPYLRGFFTTRERTAT
jgi:hypothetical protein